VDSHLCQIPYFFLHILITIFCFPALPDFTNIVLLLTRPIYAQFIMQAVKGLEELLKWDFYLWTILLFNQQNQYTNWSQITVNVSSWPPV